MQPAKQLWREASADALKLWNSLPVYLPGITSSAYKSWKSGMELVYGDAAAGRIRGVHVCAAEVQTPKPYSVAGIDVLACLSFVV